MSRRLIGFSMCGSASRILNFHFSSLLFTGLYTRKPGTLMVVSGVASPSLTAAERLNTLATDPGSWASVAARLADVTSTVPSPFRRTLALAYTSPVLTP